MKLTRIIGVSALILAPLFWPQAQAAERLLTLTYGFSQQYFDNGRDLDDERMPLGAVEYRLNDNWATEFWYAEGDANGVNNLSADIYRWHLDALYYLRPSRNLHPYLAVGGGRFKQQNKQDIGGTSEEAVEELNLGGGAHFFLTDRVSLRGDARYQFDFDESTGDFSLSLGVAFNFGPSRPEPVPASARRLDSDGDGVFNDMDDCPYTPPRTKVDERGCKITGSRVASIRLTVNFDFDKSEVKRYYFREIGELADFLKRFEDLYVDIEGHTDSIGTEDYNQSLSLRRARAVMEVLVNEYGISSERLLAKGFGESRPVANNDTEEGRAANRRVVANLEVEYED